MLKTIPNEPAHWQQILAETNPVHRIKLLNRGIEAFAHEDYTLLKKYLLEALPLCQENVVPNIAKLMVAVSALVAAAQMGDIHIFQTAQKLLQLVLAQEKNWKKNYYYLYNLSVIYQNIGDFLNFTEAYQQAIYLMISAANILDAHPSASFNIKKSHKLILSTIGDCYLSFGDVQLAEQYLLAAKNSAEKEQYIQSLPLMYLRWAGLCLAKGAAAEALGISQQMLNMEPVLVLKILIWEIQAKAYLSLEQAANALEILDVALAQAHQVASVHLHMLLLETKLKVLAILGHFEIYAQTHTHLQTLQTEYLPMRHVLYRFCFDLQSLLPPMESISRPANTFATLGQDTPTPERLFAQQMLQTIQTHYHDVNFGVETLAEYLNMSLRTLARRCQEALQHPPLYFIRQTRLQAAISLLERGQKDIHIIANLVGFRSPAYFAKTFRLAYGLPPTAYLAKKL
jgi:AraC-like DNA-binding protein/tetratricopeptide (TPR) repeat protein